jgi:tetratricopeptide (TPR) repeat protein
MSPQLAEQLKQKGNIHFKDGEYEAAVTFYSQAIQQNSTNYLLYTNRANARLKLGLWLEVIDDCLRSIDLEKNNMKAYYFLGRFSLSVFGVGHQWELQIQGRPFDDLSQTQKTWNQLAVEKAIEHVNVFW